MGIKMIKPTVKKTKFLESFTHLIKGDYLDDQEKTKLDLFVLNFDANEFDYETFKGRLVDPVIDFSLSRKLKKEYQAVGPGTLSKKAREKFKDHLTNTGELGEFLLFCFLEAHLVAPKILTKLEIKTSTSNYVHGSDGVHYLELNDGGYHIIFGESKTEKKLSVAIKNALNSIYEFKNSINAKGKQKSGMPYEKSLICSEMLKETFSKKERDFIKSIIYPTNKNKFNVDTAFGIFLGYQIKITDSDKKMKSDNFRKKIYSKIERQIRRAYKTILKNINDKGLVGHHFYIYILPFSDLDKNRRDITKHIMS